LERRQTDNINKKGRESKTRKDAGKTMGGSHGWQKACMSEALWRSLHGRVFLFLFFCNWHHIPFLRKQEN
jgi:hypothetical protein